MEGGERGSSRGIAKGGCKGDGKGKSGVGLKTSALFDVAKKAAAKEVGIGGARKGECKGRV